MLSVVLWLIMLSEMIEASMFLFRIQLIVMFIAVLLYTSAVIAAQGPNLMPVFFGDIAKLAWPGQFDLDFMCLLALSALWLAWRHQFSPAGLGLAVMAFFLSTVFLAAYLFVVSLRARGGISEILIGECRSQPTPSVDH